MATKRRSGKQMVADYFAEQFNFGGELMTRAEIYKWHADNGYAQRLADYWLMGAKQAQTIRGNTAKSA